MKKKICWFMGPAAAKHSGIANYSNGYIEAMRDRGIEISEYRFKGKHIRSALRYIDQFILAPLKLIFCRTSDIIVIYEEALVFLVPLARLWGRRAVLIVHHWPKPSMGDSLSLRLKILPLQTLLQLARFASVILCPSDTTHSELKSRFGSQAIVTLPPSFKFAPTPTYISAREVLGIPDWRGSGRRLVLYIGSDEARKNLDTLIDALCMLNYPVAFLRIGRSSSPERRVEESERLRVAGVEHCFMQDVDDNTLRAAYAVADLYVAPSLFEGFCLPIIEAQSHGVAVCASAIPVFSEVLRNSFEPVTEVMNPSSWAQAIKYVLMNTGRLEELRVAAHGNYSRFGIENTIPLALEAIAGVSSEN